jgi:hypothetical protein
LWLGVVGLVTLDLSAASFPEPRPATRIEAVSTLCPSSVPQGPCVRTRVIELATEARPAPIGVRRAAALLSRSAPLVDERAFRGPDDLHIRYTTAPGSLDRTDPADGSGNGVPDIVEGVALGAWQARGLLQRQLELPRVLVTDVALVELGDRIDGYLIPGADESWSLVLDATPVDGAEGARRSAIRLYAYAVARSLSTMPSRWAEAVAAWTVLSVDGAPDAEATALLSQRTRFLHAGLDADPVAGAGNALWLAFLEEAYGLAAVRATIEDLGRLPPSLALDSAVRRTTSDDLRAAFREFHLWAVLVGDRADSRHFPFAARLAPPAFATSSEGLPALAIRESAPVAPLGASHVLLVPDESHGGLHLRFEGDALASWDVDLLLAAYGGALRRVPVSVGPDGRGEVTVPLPGVRDAMLLVRNLSSSDDGAHRYSVTAFHEPRFPFELASLDAAWMPESRDVLVSWETTSEQSLVGFNVIRADVESGLEVAINPVWIPAMGDRDEPAAYRFLDHAADPERAYTYRIEGITNEGIAAASRSVLAPRRVR